MKRNVQHHIQLTAGAALFIGSALLFLLSGCETLVQVATEVGVESELITTNQAASIVRTSRAMAQTVESITPEQEYYIGRAVAATVLSRYPADPNRSLNLYLNELGQTLALHSDMPETFKGYHFMAVKSEEINAFAAPSGLILVTHGLLKCCGSESELAAVLAHEIGHVEQKHGLRAIRTGRITHALAVMTAETGNILGSEELSEVTQTFGESVSEITDTLINNGYSRELEYEADYRAATILSRAGYNPRALTSMLTRMGQRLGPHSGGFGKTHPTPSSRIRQINGKILRFPALQRDPPGRVSRFLAVSRFF